VFDILSHSEMAARRALKCGVHSDRTLQFVVRHGWQLPTNSENLEEDEFDRTGTTYCVVHEEGRHLASLRLLHHESGTLAQKVFRDVYNRNADALTDALEVTRLCTAPVLSEPRRRLALVELLIGLCRYGLKASQPALFGVVYPGVARSITRAGWPCDVLDRFETDNRTTLLSRWTCSAMVDWNLQERAEYLRERQACAIGGSLLDPLQRDCTVAARSCDAAPSAARPLTASRRASQL
jgi:N-acyl-L-homoserine lactone synthetase